ncbi:MAG: hypothetical protein M3327_12375, partial [Actinomycetota bacterium]|nr:hypothetical protein [Actinomycetota bacterium]
MEALARHVSRRPMPAAVVAGGDRAIRAPAIRSLARAGAPVVAVGDDASARRVRSRDAFPVLAPDPVAAPEGFVDVLLDLADVIARPSPLFPLDHDALDAIAAARERLGERYRYPFPSWGRVSAARDRGRQLDCARALGIPTPRSAKAPTHELGFPVLVKPTNAAGFRQRFGVPSFRCATRAELDDAFTSTREFEPIVEELVPNRSRSSVGSYLADDGEALAVFLVRIADRPRRAGRRARLELAATGDIVEQALALLRDLALSGLAQVDFVRDRRDGVDKLAGVEPGISRWHGVAAASGIDLTRVAYWDLLGARLPAASMSRARRSRTIAFTDSPRAVLVG